MLSEYTDGCDNRITPGSSTVAMFQTVSKVCEVSESPEQSAK